MSLQRIVVLVTLGIDSRTGRSRRGFDVVRRAKARKTFRLAPRWPLILLTSPAGPAVAVIVDHLSPRQVKPCGDMYLYIFFFAGCVGRRAGMLAVTGTDFTVEGTTSALICMFIPMAVPAQYTLCLLYTSPSPRDGLLSRMPSSA